jgi:hypothetical protein
MEMEPKFGPVGTLASPRMIPSHIDVRFAVVATAQLIVIFTHTTATKLFLFIAVVTPLIAFSLLKWLTWLWPTLATASGR